MHPSAIELIYDFFEDHTVAAAHIRQWRPLAFGFFCFAFGGAGLFFAQALTQRLWPLFSPSPASLALVILVEVVMGLLLASVLHLILDMEGFSGSVASLFVLLGLANLVWALAVPVTLIVRLVFPHSRLAASLVFLALSIASMGYKARALQDNYHLSLGRAWMTLGIPYAAVAGAAVLGFALAVWGAMIQVVRWAE